MIAESLLKTIDRGRKGENHGFSMGLPKLESVICGIIPKSSTMIFSGTGTGKSTFTLFAYVYQPLKEHLEDDLFECDYFSLEMSADDIMAKLLCLHLFDEYGVDISINELTSREKNYILPDGVYDLVQQSMEWMHKVEKVVHIYDDMCNAEKVYAIMMKTAERNGHFEQQGHRRIYIPQNPNKIRMGIIDHMSLLTQSKGRGQKEEIDLTSKYLIELREKTNACIVMIMQTNRDSASMERRKFGLNNLRISDAKDSGAPGQDAQIVLSLFSPQKERLNSYGSGEGGSYDISVLRDHFRTLTVLKNRYGQADIEIALNFFGHNGYYHEMPKPGDIYDLTKYTDPAYLLESENNPDEQKDIPDEILENNPKKFTFKL